MVRKPDAVTYAQRRRERVIALRQGIDREIGRGAINRSDFREVYEDEVRRGLRVSFLRPW